MDAFFAAVEAKENPEIAHRPIVVGADPRGGRGRGVVAACNYAAREFGIHSAMPISEAYRRCADAVFLRPRLDLYAEVSRRIMSLLETYTELVEELSIDEAFLDVTGSARLFGAGEKIARLIKRDVWERERLTVSVGVAPNKFLAKLASDLEKPDGLVVVPPGEEREFLAPLPVERIWGVGPKTALVLHRMGVTTIGDVADLPLRRLERRVGHADALRLHQLANGLDDRPVLTGRERKQISRETTFSSDVDDRDLVESTLLSLAEEVAARLRRKGVAGRTVTLKLRLAPFDTLTRRQTLEAPVCTTERIFPVARRLFRGADPGDRPIRLVGVGVSGLESLDTARQLGLFDGGADDTTSRRVAEAFDRIAERFGEGSLRRGKLLEREGPGGEAED